PTTVTVGQFQNRLNRTPQTVGAGRGVQIDVVNGTATMTGVVSSPAEAEVLVRQLRLEPGIYRIENRTSAGGN
ncbi:MAG: hypothetical protein AAF456_23095, partial [Planctomycetota bacterium]